MTYSNLRAPNEARMRWQSDSAKLIAVSDAALRGRYLAFSGLLVGCQLFLRIQLGSHVELYRDLWIMLEELGCKATDITKFTHRPIIDQSHLHHSLEDTILNPLGLVSLLHLPVKVLVQPLCLLTPKRTMEVRFAPFLGRSEKRELGYCTAYQISLASQVTQGQSA